MSDLLRRLTVPVLCGLLNLSGSGSAGAADSQQILAPGYGPLEFDAPAPGTYELPALGRAGDGNVVDTAGRSLSLHQLMGDKTVLLSFIYSTCNDVNGCPLATAVFHQVKNRLSRDADLANQVRLLTLSFNPQFDSPEVMSRYARGFVSPGLEWRFLTTRSEDALQPILQHYRQDIQKVYDRNGQFSGNFSHILRVYLIDRDKQIRNIYSVSFMHPDTLVNDIRTLLRDDDKSHRDLVEIPANRPAEAPQSGVAPLYRAGDNKDDYHSQGYQTRSVSLTRRTGRAADLLLSLRNPPLGLPPVPVPETNPVSALKVELGRKLFYDRRLSLNNTFSCAMCHIPEQGFTSNELTRPVGFEGRSVRRNAPTLYNVGYFDRLFLDSRETSLENQVWGPLLAANEMANPSIGYVVEKVKSTDDYNDLFLQAFNRGPGMDTIGMAIASYERTLNSANSAFDRWYYGKQSNALGAAAIRGYRLFTGSAKCASCHTINGRYALFTDGDLHNTGTGYARSMGAGSDKRRVQLAPGVFVDVNAAAIASVSEPPASDLGRYEITQSPGDRWKYKTPSLRNIDLTPPYMHDGSIRTLRQVVEFYNRGGIVNQNLDPLVKPLNLSDSEIDDLVAFLRTLTGDNIEALVSDAFAAPVGDPR